MLSKCLRCACLKKKKGGMGDGPRYHLHFNPPRSIGELKQVLSEHLLPGGESPDSYTPLPFYSLPQVALATSPAHTWVILPGTWVVARAHGGTSQWCGQRLLLGKVQDSDSTQKLTEGFLMKARMQFKGMGCLGHRTGRQEGGAFRGT